MKFVSEHQVTTFLPIPVGACLCRASSRPRNCRANQHPTRTGVRNDKARSGATTAAATATANPANSAGAAARRQPTAAAPIAEREATALRAILDLARQIGTAFEQGRRSAQATPTIVDEPLAHDALADYQYAVELMLRRRDNERDRLDRIEAKVAPVIGGTIAALGLFIDKASSWLDIAVGALYLIPLFMLFRIFRTFWYLDVPDPAIFVQSWQRWPQTFLKSVFEGTSLAIASNSGTIDAKARQLNGAMIWVYSVTVVVIAVRLSEVLLPKGLPHAQGSSSVASRAQHARASASSRPAATHSAVGPTTRP
jgi:hypothetical protein